MRMNHTENRLPEAAVAQIARNMKPKTLCDFFNAMLEPTAFPIQFTVAELRVCRVITGPLWACYYVTDPKACKKRSCPRKAPEAVGGEFKVR